LLGKIKEMFYSTTVTKLAALSMKKQIGVMKKQFDSSEHGGSPILGISKPVIKAHGSSDAKSFKSAIGQAIRYAETGAMDEVTAAVAAYATRKKAERAAQKQTEQ
jgi:glycerol-3-phosphate acyltransferase PlsX